MNEPESGHEDDRVDHQMGRLLQVGVLLAALVVLGGGIVYLARHGGEKVDLARFHGEPESLHSPTRLLAAFPTLGGREWIQFGLLLLVATPVARVAFSVYVFFRKRDRLYVAFTLFVLAVLLSSLAFGHLLGG